MYVNLQSRGVSGVRRPRVADLLPMRRGMAGLGWLSYPYWTKPAAVYVEVPQPAPFPPTPMPTAETMVATAADAILKGASIKFASSIFPPDYANPAALLAEMIGYAKDLCQGPNASYTCGGVDPVALGTKYANIILDALKQIPLNSTSQISVWDYWQNGARPAPVGSQPATVYTPSPLPAGYVPVVTVQPAPPVSTYHPVQTALPPVQTVSSSPAPLPPVYSLPPVAPAAFSLPDLSGLIPPAASTWLSQNWKLVAIGAAGLLILPGLMGGGGRR